jgi:hypothetical protein
MLKSPCILGCVSLLCLVSCDNSESKRVKELEQKLEKAQADRIKELEQKLAKAQGGQAEDHETVAARQAREQADRLERERAERIAREEAENRRREEEARSQRQKEEFERKLNSAVSTAAKWSLLAMRPTAQYSSCSAAITRMDGNRIEVRASVSWITAYTRSGRTMVIDLWLEIEDGKILLTRYCLHSDDHDVPIMNPTDQSVRMIVG